MTYLKVTWTHSFEDEPVEILSELDDRRREIRKVERFRNGVSTYAGPNGASGTTQLSESAIPSAEEIAADSQFQVYLIPCEAFERLWHAATVATAA